MEAGDSFAVRANASATVITGSTTTWIEIEKRAETSTTLTGLPFSDIANETQQYLIPDTRIFEASTWTNTNVANISAFTPEFISYKLDGKFVEVTFSVEIDPVSDSTQSTFDITLEPTFPGRLSTDQKNCLGCAGSRTGDAFYIKGNSSDSTKVRVDGLTIGTGARPVVGYFRYRWKE